MTLIIKNWSEHYEKSDNKKSKIMRWVAVPIKFDGLKYKRLMKRPDGSEIYGVWVALLQIAAQMPERGVFHDSGEDLTPDDMELITSIPAKKFKNAISVLCQEKFGWLRETSGQHPDNIPTTGQDITRQDNTKQDRVFPDEYKELAIHLKNRILEKRQQKIDENTILSWSNTIRLMIERDKRTLQDIRTLVDECHNMPPSYNGFTWANNVLSMDSLREKWNEGKIYIGMEKHNQRIANADTWDD